MFSTLIQTSSFFIWNYCSNSKGEVGKFSQIPSKALHYLLFDLWNTTYFWLAEFSPFNASLILIPMCCRYTRKWLETVTYIHCVICALLEFYLVQNGSFIPVFLSSRVKGLLNSWRWGQLAVLKHRYKSTTLNYAKSQNSADLTYPRQKSGIMRNIHSIKVLVTFSLHKLTTKVISF